MKILVVFYQPIGADRKTIDEHLYSFKRYTDAKCFYLNTYLGVPFFLDKIDFDLVVYHYTFLGQKFNGVEHFKKVLSYCGILKKVSGFKVALPQDEYTHSSALCDFLREFRVDKLYTCFYKQDWEKVYPQSSTNLKEIETVLTGYVDEVSLANLSKFNIPHNQRKYDIGYRARKVPFWLGVHGTIKWRITEAFQKIAPLYPKVKMNISNSEKDVFIGDKWHQFLLNCRVVLGCEGGASLHDPFGKIREKVDLYIRTFPEAGFEQVRDNCFANLDNNIELFAISPRHFDACLTKTCQVLIEGNYHGIFKPNIHYIPIKKDFSDIDEVIKKVMDVEYCENIASNAYRDVILNGNYTYANFVKGIILDAQKFRVGFPIPASSVNFWHLARANYLIVSSAGMVKRGLVYIVRRSAWRVLKHSGLLPYYKSFINRKWA